MVEPLQVVLAGLVATLALTVVLLVAAALRLGRLNFPMLLGSMFARPGPQALLIGLVWHYVNGVVFTLLYALAFASLPIEPSLATGAAFGVVHAVIGGLLLGLLGSMHPRIRQGQMPSPGAFGARYGARGVVVLLLAHLLFGAIVGVML